MQNDVPNDDYGLNPLKTSDTPKAPPAEVESILPRPTSIESFHLEPEYTSEPPKKSHKNGVIVGSIIVGILLMLGCGVYLLVLNT